MANFLVRMNSYILSKIPNPVKDLILLAIVADLVHECVRGSPSAKARKQLEKDATNAGYDNVDSYIRHSAYRYKECVAEKGAGNSMCKAYKTHWLECKEAQYGKKFAWNKDVYKMLREDATKAGYTDGYNHKKDRNFLKAIDSYEKCAATFGAGFSKCKKYKNYWLERKAAHNGIGGFAGEK